MDNLVDGQDIYDWAVENEKLRLSSIIDDLEAVAKVRQQISQEIEVKSQSNA
jgi:hypothetical protein